MMAAPMRPGVVGWIGLRPERRAPLTVVAEAEVRTGQGLIGDRWSGKPNGARQVTLIAEEDLAAIASFLGLDAIDPGELRRNIVVRGVNLAALKNARFSLGEAVLEWTGEAHPCSRMEETFGPGGYNAVRGRGGITARVLQDGLVRIGDRLQRIA